MSEKQRTKAPPSAERVPSGNDIALRLIELLAEAALARMEMEFEKNIEDDVDSFVGGHQGNEDHERK